MWWSRCEGFDVLRRRKLDGCVVEDEINPLHGKMRRKEGGPDSKLE